MCMSLDTIQCTMYTQCSKGLEQAKDLLELELQKVVRLLSL